MRIGPVELPIPFMQAGLAGYSDRAMRLVARRRGCPYAVTEALLDTLMLQGGQGLARSIDINDEDHPLAGQIIGSEPDSMSAAAVILARNGYEVIDLNFACPVKKIKNRARGGHMLRDVMRGVSILRAVRRALPGHPLSVSLRRSFDATPAAVQVLYDLLDAAFALGYVAARVHGRTVEQKYLGRADWSALAELKRRYPDRVIVGSGDVFSAESAVRMLRETGVDVVWIARGAIGNPWIFRQAATLLRGEDIAPPTIHEQRQALREHFEEAVRLHGEELAGRRMRKMGIKYARWHPRAAEVKDAFVSSSSLRDWADVLDRYYDADGPGAWPAPGAVDEVNADATC